LIFDPCPVRQVNIVCRQRRQSFFSRGRVLSALIFCELQSGQRRRTTWLIFIQRLTLSIYLPFEIMSDELYIRFKLCDGSVTDIYICTIVDPVWTDLPESQISDFLVSTSSTNGIQYVLKSYLTVMNFLVARGYEVERWDERNQEVDLKTFYVRTTS
jgi:hypothetical protein